MTHERTRARSTAAGAGAAAAAAVVLAVLAAGLSWDALRATYDDALGVEAWDAMTTGERLSHAAPFAGWTLLWSAACWWATKVRAGGRTAMAPAVVAAVGVVVPTAAALLLSDDLGWLWPGPVPPFTWDAELHATLDPTTPAVAAPGFLLREADVLTGYALPILLLVAVGVLLSGTGWAGAVIIGVAVAVTAASNVADWLDGTDDLRLVAGAFVVVAGSAAALWRPLALALTDALDPGA